jgi:hypothetical protein
LLCPRWQFACGTTARVARAGSRCAPFCIRFVLSGLVESMEDGQQMVEVGLGQAGQGFHLTVIADVPPQRLAPSMAFLRTAYLILY